MVPFADGNSAFIPYLRSMKTQSQRQNPMRRLAAKIIVLLACTAMAFPVLPASAAGIDSLHKYAW